MSTQSLGCCVSSVYYLLLGKGVSDEALRRICVRELEGEKDKVSERRRGPREVLQSGFSTLPVQK